MCHENMKPTIHGIKSRPPVYVTIAVVLCLVLCGKDTGAQQPFNYDSDDYKHTTFSVDIETYYILQWTPRNQSPFYHMGKGSSKFIELDCPHQNCYVTDNKTYLPDLTDFDAIVFNGNNVIRMDRDQSPQKRSPLQKYIFGGTESAQMKMSCNLLLENFFNWTWTYKLDSDIRWSYILIYNLEGDEVGPKINMEWPTEMKPIEDEETIAILEGKSKAAAWFVSRCGTLGGRERFVKRLKPELSKLYLTLDVYGSCGNFKCPKKHKAECYDLVKRDYYFYLSFENSFAPDYVTEKLLIALNNYAILIVFGIADYSRFLPPGSYLDARQLGPRRLARAMKNIIENRTRLNDFFRWRNHFIYKRGEDGKEICNICTALNENLSNNLNLTNSFRDWWIEGVSRKCKKSN